MNGKELTLQQKLSIEFIEDVEISTDDNATKIVKEYLKSERMAKERKAREELKTV